MNRLCEINIEEEILNGAIYVKDSFFVIEFKITTFKTLDKIREMNVLHVTQNQIKFTYYDFYQIEQSHFHEYIVIKLFTRKRINGLQTLQPEEDYISSIEISFDGIDTFFQDSSIDVVSIDKDKEEVFFSQLEFESSSDKTKLCIRLVPKSTNSHSKYQVDPVTYMRIDFIEKAPYIDANQVIDTLKYFFSFTSNRRYSAKVLNIFGVDGEFLIEYPLESKDNPSGLFVPDSMMVKDFSVLFNRIITADLKLRSVLKMFWDAASGTTESTEHLYAKWISTLETLYSMLVNSDISKEYPQTLKELNVVITNSSELNQEQKNVLSNRIVGLIDNPLRTKLIKIIQESDGFLYKVNETFLTKDSQFMNKIINTRNNFIHPNDKEKDIFSAIEVRKAVTFFKCTSFILTCIYLDIDLSKFRGYYYEKVKYFFDLIDYKP